MEPATGSGSLLGSRKLRHAAVSDKCMELVQVGEWPSWRSTTLSLLENRPFVSNANDRILLANSKMGMITPFMGLPSAAEAGFVHTE